MCDDSFNGKTVAVLGVTFKPNTDDMRDAPSLTILPALVGGGAKVRVVDPKGRREGEALLPGVDWHDDAYAAASGADCLLILTEWNQFRALDLPRIAKTMATPVMADLRNISMTGAMSWRQGSRPMRGSSAANRKAQATPPSKPHNETRLDHRNRRVHGP
jgi:UDP-glucose 6-dehydrogenase